MIRAAYTEGGRAFAAGVARRLADDVAEHVVDEVGVVDVAVVVTSPLGFVDLLTLHLALHLLPLLLLHHLLVDARQPLLHARTHAVTSCTHVTCSSQLFDSKQSDHEQCQLKTMTFARSGN